MIIGYGRTSTIEQVAGLEAQVRDLKAAGAEKLFRGFVLEYWTKASRVLIALGLTLLAGSKSCSFGCSGDIRR
jgi:hypothetical protein